MDLLIDTQSLVWISTQPEKLGQRVRATFERASDSFFVSSVTAFEYVDLNMRGRFGADLPLDPLLSLIGATVLPLPSDIWRLVEALPPLHRDPVDRMFVAHAIHADLTVITADATIREYPVKSLW